MITRAYLVLLSTDLITISIDLYDIILKHLISSLNLNTM